MKTELNISDKNKTLIRNAFKTLMGLIFNIPLLYIIYNLSPEVISVIQCVYFIVLYTILDIIIDSVIRFRNKKKKPIQLQVIWED